MNTEQFERRMFTRRSDDCRPDGGAFVVTLCIFSVFLRNMVRLVPAMRSTALAFTMLFLLLLVLGLASAFRGFSTLENNAVPHHHIHK